MPYADPTKQKQNSRKCWEAWKDSEKGRAYLASDRFKETRRRAQAAFKARHPKRAAENARKHKTGVDPDLFQQMLEAQAGLCGICTEPMRPGKDTCADHDHVTGAIRGLLCRQCNVLLGMAKDSPAILHNAAAYLSNKVPGTFSS